MYGPARKPVNQVLSEHQVTRSVSEGGCSIDKNAATACHSNRQPTIA